MAVPTLWHFPISHFNEKARWALDYKRVPHRREVLALDYLPRAWWATGQGSLPILHLDGRAIADSTAIIAALEVRHPEPSLLPRDAETRARALALEDFFDEGVGPALRAVLVGSLFAQDPPAAVATLGLGFPPGARRAMRALLRVFRAVYVRRHHIDVAALDRERRTVRAALDRVAAEVGPAGYLAGDAFSVADLTAAALLSPIVQPAEMQYPLPNPPPPLAAYQAELAEHPAFAWVEETYRRHRGTSAEVRAATHEPVG